MACTNILDGFAFATEDLDQHLFEQASHRSIWLNLIRRGIYPKGVGVTRTTFGVGHIEPTAEDTWTALSLSSGNMHIDDGVDNGCYNNFEDINWGFYEKDYSPEIAQLQGPIVCVKDLTFAHNIDDFMASYLVKIGVRAQRVWERRYHFIHRQFSKKAIATTDFFGSWKEQDALTGLSEATCELSQEMMEFVAQTLIEDGATMPDDNGFITMSDIGPLFSLYIGMEQSQRILRANATMRQDYRDAFSGLADQNPLIKRIGATRVIGNFRHIINPLPKRYTFSNGTYTEVLPWTNDANVTKGTAQVINPVWRSAPYEGADVLSADLFTSEIVPPHNANLPFDPRSYMGEWKFVTGSFKWDTDCVDPTEQRGRHFAEFLHAAKPNPLAVHKYGWHIIYKRCIGNDVECVTCSS